MDNVQPNATGPAGMGGPVNELGTPLPQMQPPVQQQAPPPDPVQVAQVAQIAHDSMFGRAAKAIMGLDNQYSVGPDGSLVNNPVKEAPGSFFRKLLGASLLGGAAGAGGDPRQGFLGGFVRGGATGMQQAQQQDQMKRKQAQEDFNNQQKVQQQNREQMLMNAQVANYHSEVASRQHTSDLADQAAHDAHNKASAALVTSLTAAGGTPAIIPVNGQAVSEFTAPDLATAYVKDPSILKGPQGYTRVFVDTTDSSGLTYNGTNWVDDSGKPINMTNHTTVKAFDVPIDAMRVKVPTSGKDINAAYGGKLMDPDKTYPMSPNDMIPLNTKRIADAKNKSDTDLKIREAKQKDRELNLKERELRDKESDTTSENDTYLQGMLSPIPTVDIYSDTSIRNNRREQLVHQAQKLDPNFNELKYKNTVGLVKDFSQGKTADSLQSFDQFLGHAGDLSQAVQNLRNTSIPLVNTPMNKLEKEVEGNPNIAAIAAPIYAAKTEFQNFLNNNHALTESDKAEGQELLSRDMSPAQFEAATKQFTRTALIRMGAINNKFRATSGVNWPTMLSDQGRTVIRNFGMGAEASRALNETLPPQAAATVKDGQYTTFNNGQVWTRTNGQVWRVQ